MSREEVITGRLQEIANTFFDGSLSPLVTHLIDRSELSAGELARLRKMVEEMDPPESEE